GGGGAKAVPENKSADLSVPHFGNHATDLFVQTKDGLPSDNSNNSSSMTLADISAKWNDLQSRLRADDRSVVACRLNENACSEAARRYLAIVDIGRKQEGRVR